MVGAIRAQGKWAGDPPMEPAVPRAEISGCGQSAKGSLFFLDLVEPEELANGSDCDASAAA